MKHLKPQKCIQDLPQSFSSFCVRRHSIRDFFDVAFGIPDCRLVLPCSCEQYKSRPKVKLGISSCCRLRPVMLRNTWCIYIFQWLSFVDHIWQSIASGLHPRIEAEYETSRHFVPFSSNPHVVATGIEAATATPDYQCFAKMAVSQRWQIAEMANFQAEPPKYRWRSPCCCRG